MGLLKQIVDQAGHFAMCFISGAFSVMLEGPFWAKLLAAAGPGVVLWVVREMVDQWPIGPNSDILLDTTFYAVGIAGAVTLAFLV